MYMTLQVCTYCSEYYRVYAMYVHCMCTIIPQMTTLPLLPSLLPPVLSQFSPSPALPSLWPAPSEWPGGCQLYTLYYCKDQCMYMYLTAACTSLLGGCAASSSVTLRRSWLIAVRWLAIMLPCFSPMHFSPHAERSSNTYMYHATIQ